MRPQDIIAAKRDGIELSENDLRKFVLDYACGRLPDYQMSAFLMAVCIRGMTFAETSAMTRAMIDSGATLDLSSIRGIKVDKHSTGGVGDKTTLVVVPILAACGLKVPKMSGRGLGFTGGTLDKLESIPGFTTALPIDRFTRQVAEIGAAMAGQTSDIVPADKRIYALRDVTATVDSIPLIAASVMSKKIACSSDVILLDVKVGSGAFMHDLSHARELAHTMIAIGKSFSREVAAVISDMNQPLGKAVGNALEVSEVVDVLHGYGPDDLMSICVELSAVILSIAKHNCSLADARMIANDSLDSGDALVKFREIVRAQGGDTSIVDDPSILPTAEYKFAVESIDTGYVSVMNTAQIGIAASILGAGRERKENSIDPAVGIIVEKKLGDHVKKGDTLAVIHASNTDVISRSADLIRDSYSFGDRVEIPPLIREVIR